MSRAYPAMMRLRDLWVAAVADNPALADNVDIYLGPLYSGDPDDAVHIGYDGDPAGEFEMVSHAQNWAALGQHRQDDIFDIHCCILNRSGIVDGESMAAAVQRLYLIWSVLTSVIKADPSMGMGPGTTENAPVWVASIRNFASYVTTDVDLGAMPRITYDVHVETRV